MAQAEDDVLDIDGILTLLDSRSFGSIWFWVMLLFAWSLSARRVLGVPSDVFGSVGKSAALPGDDPAAMLLLDWLSLTLPRRNIGTGEGALLLGLAAFLLTTLAVLGFEYGLEMAQALVLLMLPFALVFLAEMRLARRLALVLRQAETGGSVNAAGTQAARLMRRHRLMVTLLSILVVALTAFYGAIWMLMHPFGY